MSDDEPSGDEFQYEEEETSVRDDDEAQSDVESVEVTGDGGRNRRQVRASYATTVPGESMFIYNADMVLQNHRHVAKAGFVFEQLW